MKRIISLIAIAVIGFVFIGCAGSFPAQLSYNKSIEVKSKYVFSPKLYRTSTAEIGQGMYSKSYLFYNNTSDVKLLEPAIGKKGNIFVDSRKSMSISGNSQYSTERINKLRELGENKIKTMCYSKWICLTDINNTGEFTHFTAFGTADYGKLNKPAKYEIIPSKPKVREDSFKYESLYQGRKGNSIKISFREFKDNMARPAFTQDIDYELNKNGNTIIGFKGLRIEVLKATNLDITYKVIKDYN